MGGKLIQSKFALPEKRLDASEYFPLVGEVLGKFKIGFPQIRIELIEAFSKKENFGDADFLIATNPILNIKEIIGAIFHIQPYHNGDTTTIPYKGFQLDFNFVKPELFDCSKNYLNWSPGGNAKGKLSHNFKCRYGSHGLFYTLREEVVGGPRQDNSHVVDEVILTTDIKIIHEFIGLNHDRFLQGFEEEVDIFEWIGSSKYFNADRFSFAEMNSVCRVRDRKRPDYNRLVKWTQDNKDRLPSYQRLADKYDYLPMIIEKFPILGEKIEEHKILYKENQIIKSKFNGDLVREWVGNIEGKDLGRLIGTFKKETFTGSKDDYRNFMLKSSPESIKSYYLLWHNSLELV